MPAPAAARITAVSTAIQRGSPNQRRGGPVRPAWPVWPVWPAAGGAGVPGVPGWGSSAGPAEDRMTAIVSPWRACPTGAAATATASRGTASRGCGPVTGRPKAPRAASTNSRQLP
ncbi:MAG TPA: hypothetical protein VFB06_17645 [Streptosporangiaceae bacterium]|nr:hypothetical protein [Streptosporangiaceae bacterium]